MKSKLSLLCMIIIVVANADSSAQIDKFLATNPNISQIKDGLIRHKFSCTELVNGYLERIRLYNLTIMNNRAPLNAITQINPEALSEARNLDLELANNKSGHSLSGDLFCIPVIVKDHIDVKGLRTSAGSLSLFGTYPLGDAEIVRNIKEQSGIILAKSSMDEIASGLGGVSSLSGKIGNAYNPAYSSGGSSGGSAVSVAAGFAPLALGSDNSGSVRVPAAYNGVYGLRPTYGLISHNGIFPMGNLDSTAGPMANNVSDLALLLTVMAGIKMDYTQTLSESSLSGKRFAIIKSVSGKSLWNDMPAVIGNIYNDVKANLLKEGAIVTEIDLPDYNLERKNNIAGTVDEVNDYLAHNISSISAFREICLGKSRVFGSPQKCLKLVDSIKSKNSPEYKEVVKMITKNQDYVLRIMQQKQLDGLILPSGKSGIASYDWTQIGNQSIIASNSGLPEITLPIAQYNGLPVGLEIIGAKYTESALLSYAFAYQEHYYSFKAPNLVSDPKFSNWSMIRLNTLYPLIGEVSFKNIIKPADHNEITPEQSVIATRKAISMLESEPF